MKPDYLDWHLELRHKVEDTLYTIRNERWVSPPYGYLLQDDIYRQIVKNYLLPEEFEYYVDSLDTAK